MKNPVIKITDKEGQKTLYRLLYGLGFTFHYNFTAEEAICKANLDVDGEVEVWPFVKADIINKKILGRRENESFNKYDYCLFNTIGEFIQYIVDVNNSIISLNNGKFAIVNKDNITIKNKEEFNHEEIDKIHKASLAARKS